MMMKNYCDPSSYYYFEKKPTVYAKAKFKGKWVKAKAVCSPEDTFNMSIGEELAAARLDAKIAKMQKEVAIQEYDELLKEKAKEIKELEHLEEMNKWRLILLLKRLNAPKNNYLY